MSANYMFLVLWNIVLIALFLTTYVYVDKLEKTGCECSVHPYRNFVKYFPLYAVAYIIVFMFLPFNLFESVFGPAGTIIQGLLATLFGIAAIVFFVLAFIYSRWLMTEKCKCSEDVRREVLYYWSMLTIVLLAVLVVLSLAATLFASGGSKVSVKGAIQETSRLGASTLQSPRERITKISKGFRKYRS
jgi:MFS family permease